MSGVFLKRGMTVAKPELRLSLGEDGEPKASLAFQIHYDVCPIWLELAAHHLVDAEERKLSRIAAWQSDDEDAKSATLEREFESSMQALMASAIAIESFYSALIRKINIDQETVQRWRDKRTARYKQVAEVIRRAFSVKPKGTAILRENLKMIFEFRDQAVHPSGDTAAPVMHPELQIGVEWRFAKFRADNARPLVREARVIIQELVTKGRPATPEIARYAEALRDQLALSPSP
jgi:hypothetical protein